MHVGYLSLFALAGWLVARRTFAETVGQLMTLAALPLRILPPQVVTARRPQRMLERSGSSTAPARGRSCVTRILRAAVLPAVDPCRLRRADRRRRVRAAASIPYADFVAPALFAASAMNGSIYEATNIFFRLKYDKVYESVLATPITSGDVALGEMLYATMRGAPLLGRPS